jgi:hypothetical protein
MPTSFNINHSDKERGRPSKKTTVLLAKLLSLIRKGRSRRSAAISCKISPKTIQLWLRYDLDFRESISNAERAGLSRRAYVAWFRHPFRGKRPPRGKKTRGKSYPKPAFSIH